MLGSRARWRTTTARTRAVSAPNPCGASRRSSARSVAPIRSSELIDLRDLEGGGEGATEVATLARNRAARARGALTMTEQGAAGAGAAGRAAVEGTGRVARAGQVAGGQRMSSVEKAAGSGRRQTETRGVAEEGKSEHEGGRRGNVSTIGEGASARSAEGGASASPIGQDASARSAGEGASHLPARLAKERVQGVRRGEHLPA